MESNENVGAQHQKHLFALQAEERDYHRSMVRIAKAKKGNARLLDESMTQLDERYDTRSTRRVAKTFVYAIVAPIGSTVLVAIYVLCLKVIKIMLGWV